MVLNKFSFLTLFQENNFCHDFRIFPLRYITNQVDSDPVVLQLSIMFFRRTIKHILPNIKTEIIDIISIQSAAYLRII